MYCVILLLPCSAGLPTARHQGGVRRGCGDPVGMGGAHPSTRPTLRKYSNRHQQIVRWQQSSTVASDGPVWHLLPWTPRLKLQETRMLYLWRLQLHFEQFSMNTTYSRDLNASYYIPEMNYWGFLVLFLNNFYFLKHHLLKLIINCN